MKKSLERKKAEAVVKQYLSETKENRSTRAIQLILETRGVRMTRYDILAICREIDPDFNRIGVEHKRETK